MQGMFGQDPAIIQQGLQQQQDQAMMQQAQLDPWSAVAYGAGSAAQRLGSGIGGMLGYEDPQMKQANTIKKIQEESLSEAKAMGIDPSKDMEKFAEIVAGKYTAAGMPDKAFDVHQMVQGMKAKQADIGLKQAKTVAELKKAQREASPFSKIEPNKYTPESIQKFLQSGDQSDLRAAPSEKTKVVNTAEGVFVIDEQGNKIQRVGSPFASTNISMGGTKDFAKIQGLREGFLKEVKPLDEKLSKIDEIITTAKGATTNPVDAASLPNLLANYFGDAQTAKAEIERFSRMGSLYDKAIEMFSKGVVGTASEDGVKAILAAIYKHRTTLQNKRRLVTSQYNKIGDLSEGEREYLTGGYSKDEKGFPTTLNINGKEYKDVSPDNIKDIIKNSGMSKEEKIQWLEYAISQGWDE